MIKRIFIFLKIYIVITGLYSTEKNEHPFINNGPESYSAEYLFTLTVDNPSISEKEFLRDYLMKKYPATDIGLICEAYFIEDKVKCIALLQKALDLNPENSIARWNLMAKYSGEDNNKKLEILLSFFQFDNNDMINDIISETYFTYLNSLKSKEKADDFLNKIKSVFIKEDLYVFDYINGITLFKAGKYEKALECFESAMNKEGVKNFEILKYIADIRIKYLYTDKTAASKREITEDILKRYIYPLINKYNKKISLSDLNGVFFIHKSLKYIAGFYTDNQDYKSALALLKSAVKIYPAAETFDDLMLSYIRTGSTEEGFKYLKSYEDALRLNYKFFLIEADQYLGRGYVDEGLSCYDLAFKKAYNKSCQEECFISYNQNYSEPYLRFDDDKNLIEKYIADENKKNLYLYYNNVFLKDYDKAEKVINNINNDKYKSKIANIHDDMLETLCNIKNKYIEDNLNIDIVISANLSLKKGIKLSKDSKYFLCSNDPVELRQSDTGKKIREFKGDLSVYEISPDNKYICAVGRWGNNNRYINYIVVFNSLNGDILKILPVPYADINDMDWSPNGRQIVFLTSQGIIIKYDIDKNAIGSLMSLKDIYWPKTIIWGALNKYIAVLNKSPKGKQITILDADTFNIKKELTEPSWPHAIEAVCSGKYLICSDNERTLHRWTIGTWEYTSMKTYGISITISKHPFYDYALLNDFGGSENDLLSCKLDSSWNKTALNELTEKKKYSLEIIDIENMKIVSTDKSFSNPNYSHFFSHDGRSVISYSLDYDYLEKRNFEKDKVDDFFTYIKADSCEPTGAFKYNDLFITCDSGYLKIWDMRYGRIIEKWDMSFFSIFQNRQRPEIILCIRINDKKESEIYELNASYKKLKLLFKVPYIVQKSGFQSNALVLAGTVYISDDMANEEGIIEVFSLENNTIKIIKSIKVPLITEGLRFGFAMKTRFVWLDINNDLSKAVILTSWVDGWNTGFVNTKTVRIFDLNTGMILSQFPINYDAGFVFFKMDNILLKYRKFDEIYIYSEKGKYLDTYTDKLADVDISTWNWTNICEKFNYNGFTLMLNENNEIIIEKAKDHGIIKILNTYNGGWISISSNFNFEYNADENQNYVSFIHGFSFLSPDQFWEHYYVPGLLKSFLSDLIKSSDIKNISESINKYPPPVVSVINPDNGQTTDNQYINVILKIEDTGGGIDEVKVLINGKRIEDDNMKLTKLKKNISHMEYLVPLMSGENILKVSAFSKDRIESACETRKIYFNKPGNLINYHILMIGINEYKNSALKLNYAINDCMSMTECFSKMDKEGIGNINIYELYDEMAEKRRIIDALDMISKNSKPEDFFILYFSGHGYMADKTKEFYFLTYDCDSTDEKALLQKGLSITELKDKIVSIIANKQVFIIDACQSGSAALTLNQNNSVIEKALLKAGRNSGSYIFAASKGEEYSIEDPRLEHGYFTYVLLKGLDGEADLFRDRIITVKEISTFIDYLMPQITEKYSGIPQSPVISSNGTDFILKKY